MKKYLFIALAALGFAACENGADEVTPNQGGELEQSYVAISLAADDATKAAGDKYEDGLDEERAVNSAYVFFFKEGAAFMVTGDNPTTNTGSCNYLKLDLTPNATNNDKPNVSDVKNAVLVLRNYKGEYPDKMVAVLNWDPTAKKSYTLSELKTKILELGDDTNGFVMSNSVYMDEAGQVVDAVPLTIENIFKKEEEAIKNPVTIHVERIAAKVSYTANNDGKFYVGKEIDGEPIYAKIEGFELFNDYQTSWLIKRIDTNWTVGELGFNWNDFAWYRSYWANSIGTDFPNNQFNWNDNQTKIGEFDYCGENTRTWSEADDVRTKVIVKARLVKNDAANTPVEVVNWYGKDYIGEDNLKVVVANTLANTYYHSTDGMTFTSIAAEDLMCVERGAGNENAFEVYFQLSTTGDAKTWYKYADGKYTAEADFNTTLAGIEPALVYNDGMTYYYTNIRHLGANEDDKGYYGVVRNHVYKVNISEIQGYGTPVYNGDTNFITPEKPKDITTFVAAEIKILSWRVVEHNYPLN